VTVVVSCLCGPTRAVEELIALHWRCDRSHGEEV
jgi:hypothetical protein